MDDGATPEAERPSRYLRTHHRNLHVRRLAARMLLAADLEQFFTFRNLDKVVLGLFDRFDLDPKQFDEIDVVVPWLERQLEVCGDATIDESDPFAINTRRIATDLALDGTELELLRFALLVAQSTALKKASTGFGDGLAPVDAADALAAFLDLSARNVHRALMPSAKLRRTGLLPHPKVHGNTGELDDWLNVPQALTRLAFERWPGGLAIEEAMFAAPVPCTLNRRDFAHLGTTLDTLVDYLKYSCTDRATGANLLLWGPPGTGKTELARWLVRAARRRATEVGALDEDGNPRSAAERLGAYRLCQGILPADGKRIVLFDEVEEVLSDAGFVERGFRQSEGVAKSYLNELLETNPLPTVWITNTLSGIDPAYLRRFDLCVEIGAPAEPVRRRIAQRAFAELPSGSDLVDAIAAHSKVVPAEVRKASKVCERLRLDQPERVDAVARLVIDCGLKAAHRSALETPMTKRRPRVPTLPTDPSVLNTDMDADTLLERLSVAGFGRLCFHSPPGTGKTALAAEIAKRMGKPLLLRQAADILGPYVGMTESNIARTFEEAVRDDAVLVFDEADSFLQERRHADKGWQVTQVNQFLTSLERHDGVVVCTTNLMEGLDAAALRRFDFKVAFGCLDGAQARRMVGMVLEALGRDEGVAEAELVRLAGARLVPGDFPWR